jgi:hypothetical protein
MKSQEKLIAEIHNEFDSAQERLLQQARQIIESNKVDDLGLSVRLLKVGFASNPIVKQTTKRVDLRRG